MRRQRFRIASRVVNQQSYRDPWLPRLINERKPRRGKGGRRTRGQVYFWRRRRAKKSRGAPFYDGDRLFREETVIAGTRRLCVFLRCPIAFANRASSGPDALLLSSGLFRRATVFRSTSRYLSREISQYNRIHDTFLSETECETEVRATMLNSALPTCPNFDPIFRLNLTLSLL